MKTSTWYAMVLGMAAAAMFIMSSVLVSCWLLGYFGIIETLGIGPEAAGALGCFAGFVGGSVIVVAAATTWRVCSSGALRHHRG